MFDVACTSFDLLVRTALEATYHMEMESMKGKYQPCEWKYEIRKSNFMKIMSIKQKQTNSFVAHMFDTLSTLAHKQTRPTQDKGGHDFTF